VAMFTRRNVPQFRSTDVFRNLALQSQEIFKSSKIKCKGILLMLFFCSNLENIVRKAFDRFYLIQRKNCPFITKNYFKFVSQLSD